MAVFSWQDVDIEHIECKNGKHMKQKAKHFVHPAWPKPPLLLLDLEGACTKSVLQAFQNGSSSSGSPVHTGTYQNKLHWHFSVILSILADCISENI